MSAGLDALRIALRSFTASDPVIAAFPVEVEIDGMKVRIYREFWLVAGDFTDNTQPPQESRTMVALDGINIREKPDVASRKIGSIAKDAEIVVVGQPVNGYLKLRDKNGWVIAEWLKEQ